MNQTVIGYFDSRAEAQQAVGALQAAGFQARLSDQTVQDAPSTTTESAISSNRVEGMFDSIRNFFSDVFGNSHEHLRDYEEGVRRGGCVVKVGVADDDGLDRATAILEDAGAADIDERASQWRTPSATTTGLATGASAAYAGATDSIANELTSTSTRTADPSLDEGSRRADRSGVRVYPRTAETTQATAGLDSPPAGAADYVDAYRSDYDTRYAALGGSYDEYEPAYQYGHSAAKDQSYGGRAWDEVEPSLRSDWSARNPSSPWEKVKEGVKHAWHVAKG
jgi:hypothetical protein